MRIEWINPEALVRPAEGGLSRRSFIKAGALAGGGLVLGFFMPGANKFARAADAPKPSLRAQRLPAHRAGQHGDGDGQPARIRPGRAYVAADADCRRPRLRLVADARRTGAGRRRLQGSGLRHADDRRLGQHRPLVFAVPRNRRQSARDADCCRGRAVEGQAGAVQNGQGIRDGPGRPEGQLRFARRRRHAAADAGHRRAEGRQGLQHHRQADQAHRRARQVERQAAVRHRLHAAQYQGRGGGAPAGVRRQGRQAGRQPRRRPSRA